MDDKALLAARVTDIWPRCCQSAAARVKFSEAIVRAWWRVWLPLEVEFLGFGRDMQGSTSVVLASSGEAWICADLIGRGADCLGLSIYRRLNPRLLVQAGLGLGLLHWANMSNIYL